jgi:hypothetical protein
MMISDISTLTTPQTVLERDLCEPGLPMQAVALTAARAGSSAQTACVDKWRRIGLICLSIAASLRKNRVEILDRAEDFGLKDKGKRQEK